MCSLESFPSRKLERTVAKSRAVRDGEAPGQQARAVRSWLFEFRTATWFDFRLSGLDFLPESDRFEPARTAVASLCWVRGSGICSPRAPIFSRNCGISYHTSMGQPMRRMVRRRWKSKFARFIQPTALNPSHFNSMSAPPRSTPGFAYTGNRRRPTWRTYVHYSEGIEANRGGIGWCVASGF